MLSLLIHPIGELVTPEVDGGPARGKGMSSVRRIKDAALAIAGDRIIAAGPAREVLAEFPVAASTQIIDASNKLVTPGFVDPHTHVIFAGNRANEFMLRCQGKTYAEIARAGGGIVASVNATRQASLEQLISLGQVRLQKMLAAGTTTCEIKTGYGLDIETELRMLKAIIRLAKSQPVEIKPTFMPAHAIPPGVDRKAYVQEIVSEMLPLAAAIWKNENTTELPLPFKSIFCDVFCDEGYFTIDDTRLILEAGLQLGFKLKVHADEFANLGATTLAVHLKAVSADHLLQIANHEIDLLSRSNTVAVLLPGTSFYLNLDEHAPARKMIDHGVAVALGSDFNPGSCHIFSLPLIFSLACLKLKMTIEETLTALTVNAAYAIDLGEKIGQLRPGYQADIAILDLENIEELPYNLGWNPVIRVIKRGKVVYPQF